MFEVLLVLEVLLVFEVLLVLEVLLVSEVLLVPDELFELELSESLSKLGVKRFSHSLNSPTLLHFPVL